LNRVNRENEESKEPKKRSQLRRKKLDID
jgi:hypothetical protein